jgi:hypothetical protein
MDGIPIDKSNGYRCNSFDDATNDGALKRTYFDSMSEGMNEEGNGEEKEEQGDNENERRNFCIPSKGRFVWQSVECDLADDVGLFIVSGFVIDCDLKEAILDNQLGEDHVKMSILYFLNNVSTVMTIWKWPLAQTIVDGYSLRQLLVSCDESKIPTIDEEGEIGVRKKQYNFQKKK